jgi:hypothetical protein
MRPFEAAVEHFLEHSGAKFLGLRRHMHIPERRLKRGET